MSGPAPGREPGGRDASAALAAPPGRVGDAVFWPFRAVVGGALRLWLRMRVENAPRLTGACVLAANHASLLDPIVLGAAFHRRISFLMTETVFRSPALGWFYRWNRSIPLAVRSANRDAMRAARSVLQQGRVIGIFPEGGLSRDGGLLLGNPGAVSLVLQEGVPIVPVGIVGAERALPLGARWPRPTPVIVRFGPPIPPDELGALHADRRQRLQAATRRIMTEIARLTGTRTREDQLADASRR